MGEEIGRICLDIIKYFNINEEVTRSCIDQIEREFEFESGVLNIK